MRLALSNCWDCGFQVSGCCTWFPNERRIPMDIADKGCQYFKQRTVTDVKADNIISKIVEVFDGESVNA